MNTTRFTSPTEQMHAPGGGAMFSGAAIAARIAEQSTYIDAVRGSNESEPAPKA